MTDWASLENADEGAILAHRDKKWEGNRE